MRFLRNFSTRGKLLALIGVFSVFLGLVALVGYRATHTTAKALDDVYHGRLLPVFWINDIRAHTNGVQTNLYALMLTTDEGEKKELLGDIGRRQKIIAEAYASYEKNPLDAFEQEHLAKAKILVGNARDVMKETIALAMEGKNVEAYAVFRQKAQKAVAEYIAELVVLADYNTKRAEETNDANDAAALRAERFLGGLALGALVLSVLLGLLIARLIATPLGTLMEGIGRFSAGDLTVTFDDAGKDEVGRMGAALESLGEALRGALGQIAGEAVSLGASAEAFSALAREVGAGVEESRRHVVDVNGQMESLSAASEEINASVEEVAAGAQSTAQKGTEIAGAASEAQRAGEEGIAAVGAAVSGIEEVARDASGAAGAVKVLGDRARQIQSFVAQIGGIADQTNLLALNAAIEAARAGEAGRGFAVVAEEVRKLAEESNLAARSIADIAGAITKDLDRVLQAAERNASASQGASALARDTEDKIRHMIDGLALMAGSTQDLAAVSEEQAASSEEIASAVQDVSAKVQNAAAGAGAVRRRMDDLAATVGRVSSGAEDLARLSGTLTALVGVFRLETEAASPERRALPHRRG